MGGSLSGFEQCQTVADTLKKSSELQPDKEVFIFYDKSKTTRNPFTAYKIYELGGRFASRLRHQGFQKGDVIINTLPNCPERIITDIGIMLAGCTGMHGQILLADGEDFFSSAKNSLCSAVILPYDKTAASWRLIGAYISDVTSDFTTVSCGRAPTMKKAIIVTREREHGFPPLMEDLMSSSDAIFNCQDISPEDYAYVHVTSGSTGYSKMVPRSHKELLDINRIVHEEIHSVYPYDESDVLFSDRSLGWIAGFPHGQYCMGATRVLVDAWDPQELGNNDVEGLWNLLRAENCSTFFSMPTLANDVLNNLDLTRGSKVKVLLIAGQPITKNTIKDYLEFSGNVLNVYGMTEIGVCSIGIYDNSDLVNGRVKDYISGHVLKEMNARIVDTNNREVPTGETGYIQIKGTTVFSGYLNHSDKSDFTPDGWLRTGDDGCFDDVGNIYVYGRLEDNIHHGNCNLYPSWLEGRIQTHPDVQEVCVVPVPHPVLYHAICACVRRRDGCLITEDDLKTFCESLFLVNSASVFCPMPKHFMILGPEFPHTATGKIDRQKLKKMAAEKFGS